MSINRYLKSAHVSLCHFGDTLGHYLKKPKGIMVNVVPREIPRPKPEGPQAPRVLAAEPPEAQHLP